MLPSMAATSRVAPCAPHTAVFRPRSISTVTPCARSYHRAARRARTIVSAAAADAESLHTSAAAADAEAPSLLPPPSPQQQQPLELPSGDSRLQGLGKVLVAGATGGVGRAVVQQLVAQGVPVRALVRDGVRAASLLPPYSRGVEIVVGDTYKFSDAARALEGCSAVICATGPTNRLDPLGPFKVDCEGVKNLVAAAQQQDIAKFVLVTSIGCDDPLFPLNAYWGVLFWKKQGESALQRSGLNYTVVRPGGLLDKPRRRSGSTAAAAGPDRVVLAGPDSFGLPPRRRPGSVLRSQVAECCVAALVEPAARGKVVEMIAEEAAPHLGYTELFSSVA